MSIRRIFGKTNEGIEAEIFTLSNKNGMKVQITNYGGTVVSINFPDKDGIIRDVVLGYDNLEGYLKGDKYLGALIGRCGNRIEHGKFSINGEEYTLAINNGNNHNHGGLKAFDKVVWDAELCKGREDILKLSYLSKDGEEGYPGNLKVEVTYEVTENNELKIDYKAVTDKDTVVNLTNHSYFNLSGVPSKESALAHKLMINSDTFTANNAESIPTGEIREVSSTPMDFREFKEIGKDIEEDYDQLKFARGYDHNWLINNGEGRLRKAATLFSEESGIAMDTYTTTPGVQLYTSNFLDGTDIGKNNIKYDMRSGICLETQFVPNAINNDKFESTLLKVGDVYDQTTIYKFYIL